MVLPMPPIEETASSVAPWMDVTWAAISSVALAVWLARVFDLGGDHGKALAASPARAASMVALSANRLVWLAMSLMSSTTSQILLAASARPWTISLERFRLFHGGTSNTGRPRHLIGDLLNRTG